MAAVVGVAKIAFPPLSLVEQPLNAIKVMRATSVLGERWDATSADLRILSTGHAWIEGSAEAQGHFPGLLLAVGRAALQEANVPGSLLQVQWKRDLSDWFKAGVEIVQSVAELYLSERTLGDWAGLLGSVASSASDVVDASTRPERLRSLVEQQLNRAGAPQQAQIAAILSAGRAEDFPELVQRLEAMAGAWRRLAALYREMFPEYLEQAPPA